VNGLRGYKLCKGCGQPMLKKGQKRKDPHDYRHARGCPKASPAERKQTEAMWAELERRAKR
jgi:hypothetical protein